MNEALIAIGWITYILWKIVVFISFPLIFLIAYQGYPLGYRRITGREYQVTGGLVRRQIVFRILFWLSFVALGGVWLYAVDNRIWKLILSLAGWLDPINSP